MGYEGVIGAIYDAALTEDGWDAALSRLGEYFQSPTVDLFHRDLADNCPIRDVVGVVGFSPKDHAAYADHFAATDARWRALLHMPPETVLADDLNYTVGALRKSAVFNEFYRPLGLGLGLGVRLFGDTRRHAVFALRRAQSDAGFSRDQVRDLETIIPHLRRALQMRRQFMRATSLSHGLRAALDRFPTAIFILDELGRLSSHNRAAEDMLRDGGALRLEARRLKAGWAGENDILVRVISDVIATARGEVRPVPPIVTLRDRLGIPRLSMLVSPVTAASGVATEGGASVVVFAIDRSVAIPIDCVVLGRQFGFTNAEARVAAEIARGQSAEEIALANKTTLNTVRSQLKRAMDKADARSQGQLASKILLSLATFTGAPLRPSAPNVGSR